VLNLVFRTIVLGLLVLTVLRLVGKRSIANMAPFDFAIIIIMGSVAAIPIEEQTGLIHGIVPIIVLAIMQWALEAGSARSRRVERIVQGTSTILIQDGRILHQNLKKENVSIADLWLELRESGIDNIGDVQQLTLEPDGKVSVIKTKAASPVTPKDIYKLSVLNTYSLTERSMLQNRERIQDILARRSLSTQSTQVKSSGPTMRR